MESAAFAVPTVTSDLAGFGQWILSGFGNNVENCGVRVIHRTDSNYNHALQEMVKSVTTALEMPPKVLKNLGKVAQKVARSASWDKFIDAYNEAYRQALERIKN